ncbi:sigma-54-dependent transcriptional regulator [Chrysiogenes arsenatis]|uniref:sigma-54-dependent transcriptional regulator n=1 Tax=Chrysiogenes arsenatis TaxID=309797 RepID=UPI000422BA20|nr:sigma-54 dependent transcriptional regulator [Chrysiogenes arsenatis]
MKKILIIDDEASIGAALTFALEDNYDIISCTDPAQGLAIAEKETFHLCLLDLKIGNVDGIDVLRQLKTLQPAIEVIMITAYGTIESSVRALQNGAFSYVTKPINIDELLVSIERALDYKRLNSQVEYLARELEQKYRYRDLVGNSRAMEPVYRLIDRVKDVDSAVLITGESGTGKELVARAIHFSGKRNTGPLEVVNCAAIPEHLLESELFGYEKGAFTGAVGAKPGKFEVAHGGTIFLDEIGDMPLALQAKLLRVLQTKKVSRLGSNKTLDLDFRVISATNHDLSQAISAKSFREDLFFRINVIQIDLPPLRARAEDIPLLAHHFLKKYNDELGFALRLSSEALQRLSHYHFPGNIRELANIIESSMVMAGGAEIGVGDLPGYVRHVDVPANVPQTQSEASLQPFVGLTLKELEKRFIETTLASMGGHRKKTAEVLGISERNLRYQLNSAPEPEEA